MRFSGLFDRVVCGHCGRRGSCRVSVPAVLLFSIVLGGCAAGKGPAPAHASGPPGTTHPPLEVAPIVVSPYGDAELAAQFEHGRVLLLADDARGAADVFDRLLRLAPDGEIAPPSLFNSGLAHEALGDREIAAARYRDLTQRFPEHPVARAALFRRARVSAYLELWPELIEVATSLIGRGDLSILESIEAFGARALALVEQGQIDEAARQVGLARDLIEVHRLGESGKPPLELAQVSFALGEIRKRRSEAIRFVPLPPAFGEVLEQRCQGLLDAQSAYSDAMRSLDAHWSAMAGYRVGQLYQELHRDVMQIPAPAKADTLKKKQLFEGAMRLRYRVLLEKGQAMLAGTVRLGERTGESSAWVLRARDAQREIERSLADEQAALSKLPFTEAELKTALDALTASAPKRP